MLVAKLKRDTPPVIGPLEAVEFKELTLKRMKCEVSRTHARSPLC